MNQYLKTNQKAIDSLELNKKLFKIDSEDVKYFIRYESKDEIDKYMFIKIEYCPVGTQILELKSHQKQKKTSF